MQTRQWAPARHGSHGLEPQHERRHSQVRWVVSWPPPCVPVPMNVVTALPTSEPFCHSWPVASQNALNWAAGEPYLHRALSQSERALCASHWTSAQDQGEKMINT